MILLLTIYITKTVFANFLQKFLQKKRDLTKLLLQRISLSPHYIIIFCKLQYTGSCKCQYLNNYVICSIV
ncbi:hypothetical protein BGAFAR04_Ab0033 (plasmid) [Borreliella garinii Far04]|nr:hypothetical protein BGAFAR04_Ab0033 [Borreliella garinii Far04]